MILTTEVARCVLISVDSRGGKRWPALAPSALTKALRVILSLGGLVFWSAGFTPDSHHLVTRLGEFNPCPLHRVGIA